jgi:diaminohydroxyphosphoribosylaminopyrimidine deaminase/5-amino-6-(5-phosphoribosylamino)uracil reductase
MFHATYMQRCIELARLGIPWAFPNPLVGAVLVHENRIIGEGYHARFGEGHAEVNCLASVNENDRHLISKATLYVSLEPCSHTGKTPPCANLIIHHNIPKVVVACLDPSEKVNGRGIARLREAGIDVETNILEQEARALNPGFFTYHEKHRPYITLKWAQSADGFIGKHGERTPISTPETQVLVHDWRRQHQAIWVGFNTVKTDQPLLNNRLHPGPSPIRVVFDKQLQHIQDAHYFNDQLPAWIFTKNLSAEDGLKRFIAIGDAPPVQAIIHYLYEQHIQSVLVEGGTSLINSLIEQHAYDDIRCIQSNILLQEGIPAPHLPEGMLPNETMLLSTDTIQRYTLL